MDLFLPGIKPPRILDVLRKTSKYAADKQEHSPWLLLAPSCSLIRPSMKEVRRTFNTPGCSDDRRSKTAENDAQIVKGADRLDLLRGSAHALSGRQVSSIGHGQTSMLDFSNDIVPLLTSIGLENTNGVRNASPHSPTEGENDEKGQDLSARATTPLPQLQSAPRPKRKVKRIGEESFGIYDSGEIIHGVVETGAEDQGTRIPAHESASTTAVAKILPVVSTYQVKARDSGDGEDEKLDRKIDLELKNLSVSLARMRRIAEEMAREISAQNETLARMLVKEDRKVVDKAADDDGMI
jgi:hypothetical protein